MDEELTLELEADYDTESSNENMNKRPLDGSTHMETGDDKRRAGGPEVHLRLLCPINLTGSVIGKGGETIKAMRAETDCKIRIEDPIPGCEERVVYLDAEDTDGTDLCPCQNALLRVVEKLGEATDNEDETFTVRLLVWDSQIGAIIGKGGSAITKLRESTGAQIRVLPKQEVPMCASTGDEVCQIIGKFPKVFEAVSQISSTLRANPPKDLPGRRSAASRVQPVASGVYGMPAAVMSRTAGPGAVESVFRMLIPTAKAGSVIGRGGDVIKRIRDETGAQVRLMESDNDPEWRVVTFTSLEDPMSPFCAAQEALVRVFYTANDDGSVPGARLLVPKTQVGAILGKGGAVIKGLRAETGAIIQVLNGDSTPPCADPDDEMVCVDGADYAVDAALRGVTLRLRSVAKPPAPSDGTSRGGGSAPSATRVRERAAENASHKAIRLSISSDQVGGIIGKGGANITQIRQISGAKVQLHPANDAGEREIEIEGTEHECQSAQNLVQAFLWKSGAGPVV